MSVDALTCYLIIFGWLFFTGIGIPPVPEEIGIGYAAATTSLHPDVRWWLAWPATMAGIVAADMVLYGVGRWSGPRLFRYRWVNYLIPTEKRRRIEERFHEHGVKILLTARLIPPLRTSVFIIAGVTHYPFDRFVLADGVYLIFGVGLFFFGFAWLADLLKVSLIEFLHGRSPWYVYMVVVGVSLMAWILLHRLRKNEIGMRPDSTLAPVPASPRSDEAVRLCRHEPLTEATPPAAHPNSLRR